MGRVNRISNFEFAFRTLSEKFAEHFEFVFHTHSEKSAEQQEKNEQEVEEQVGEEGVNVGARNFTPLRAELGVLAATALLSPF